MQHSQDLSQALISNLSLSQYSWEKQKRFTTDEDVLCSYSKLSNVSPIKESLKSKGKQYHQPPLEESINLHQETDKEKDDKIKQLEEYHLWLQQQNEKMMINQQMMMYLHSQSSEEQVAYQKKQDEHIHELEKQITQCEQQLHKSLKCQGLLEKENSILKTKLIDCDRKLFEQENYKQQNEQFKLKLLEQESSYSNKVQEFQKFCTQQDAYISKIEKDLQLSRKNSREQINKQYKSVILREKSPSGSLYDQQQVMKFVDCIVDMVMNCTPNPPSMRPKQFCFINGVSLKKCWKWLKNILEDYMTLKKQSNKFVSTQCSQYIIADRKRETNSFFNVNDVHRRFQTSVEDSENKFLRSNTLLTKLNNK